MRRRTGTLCGPAGPAGRDERVRARGSTRARRERVADQLDERLAPETGWVSIPPSVSFASGSQVDTGERSRGVAERTESAIADRDPPASRNFFGREAGFGRTKIVLGLVRPHPHARIGGNGIPQLSSRSSRTSEIIRQKRARPASAPPQARSFPSMARDKCTGETLR